MVWFSVAMLVVAVLCLLVSYLSVRRAKKKIRETMDILADIKQGKRQPAHSLHPRRTDGAPGV